MDTEKIWEEGEWTNEAHQIIDGLRNFPDNSKILLILRHSHRNESKRVRNTHPIRRW